MLEKITAFIVHSFNNFFNHFCRDSENYFVKFIWKTCILVGWVKLLLELKYIFDFVLKNFVRQF